MAAMWWERSFRSAAAALDVHFSEDFSWDTHLRSLLYYNYPLPLIYSEGTDESFILTVEINFTCISPFPVKEPHSLGHNRRGKFPHNTYVEKY